MIEQIEELGLESQVLPFPEVEHFAEREIYIFLRWSDDAVAGGVPVERCITGGAVRKGGQGIGLIGGRIYPTYEARLRAAVTRGIAATKSWHERRS